jgi:predicted AlkP superfamily pyrophosphatase or phosphodiesterase
MKKIILVLALFLSSFAAPLAHAEKAALSKEAFLKKPKLVVAIVIDQFRADYLTRFASRFLPAQQSGGAVGGFQYLMSHGAYFPFAQYDVFQCMTGPGHAMILTGAYPYQMGISLNEWFDQKTQKNVYCAEDADAEVVGAHHAGGGYSPRNLKGSTVGDELKNAGYHSRVVAIALKDRAAILLGGHRADLAVWLDSDSYRWVSSRYYLKDGKLPAWMDELNGSLAKHKGEDYIWKGIGKETGLSNPFDAGNFERKFTVGSKEAEASPMGVTLTTDAALQALKAYHLGQNADSDLLAISYSSHDLLGHHTGPNAREMEELTIAEDRSIADLLNGIRKTLPGGLKDVVFTFTGDHGISPTVPYLKSVGFDAGSVDVDALTTKLNKALESKFGKADKGSWILSVHSFNFYLNLPAVAARKLNVADVESELKRLLEKEPAAAFVFTRAEYEAHTLPPGMHARQIGKGYNANNGEVVMIPKPYYMEAGPVVTHMTGYNYDRSVPLIIAGARVRAGVYAKAVDVVDLAPTLSFLLGILPPSLSEGRVLHEAIGSN